ncbi:MAG: hypothetical protein AAF682_14470 [Planctomycetota bacterium]
MLRSLIFSVVTAFLACLVLVPASPTVVPDSSVCKCSGDAIYDGCCTVAQVFGPWFVTPGGRLGVPQYAKGSGGCLMLFGGLRRQALCE